MTMQADTPINRKTIDDMSPKDLAGYVDGIRERRMKTVIEHRKAQDLIAKQRHDKISEKLVKQTDMLAKEITQLDKKIEKVENRVANVVSLRAELEELPNA